MKRRILPKLNVGKKPENNHQKQAAKPALEVRKGNYWEDPAYRHLVVLQKSAEIARNAAEFQRISLLMKQAMDGTLPQGLREEFGQAFRKHRAEVKLRQSQMRRAVFVEKGPAKIPESSALVDVKALKATVYNYQASMDKVLAAFDALPKSEQSAIAKKLPPYLRRRIGAHLKAKGLL